MYAEIGRQNLGAVSAYNQQPLASPIGVPSLIIVKRLRLEGFIAFDLENQDKEALQTLSDWLDLGLIQVRKDIINGLENPPGTLADFLVGENFGKRLIRVAPDP